MVQAYLDDLWGPGKVRALPSANMKQKAAVTKDMEVSSVADRQFDLPKAVESCHIG